MGMSRVFWDSNIFIYLLEEYGPLTERAINLRKSMLRRRDELVTSTITLGEVLVHPNRNNRPDIARAYEQEITQGAHLIPFDVDAARIFAAIRCDKTIKAPDAIQLACAAQARCDLFITNDDRLSGKIVPGIQFVTSLQRAPI
jgi:predicted nucleic acid-binding protein